MGKTKILTVVLFAFIAALSVACKELKVGVDDDTLSALECVSNPDSCDDSEVAASDDSESEDAESEDVATDTETCANDIPSEEDPDAGVGDTIGCGWGYEEGGGGIAENGTALNGDSSDQSGGIFGNDNYQRNSSATFLGTWTRQDYSYDYGKAGGEKCEYNFPNVVRMYGYDDNLAFENQSGDLVMSAAIFPDNTFDFESVFSDQFGRPSVDVLCTCEIVSSYSDAYPDELNCTCDGSDTPKACLLYFEEM